MREGEQQAHGNSRQTLRCPGNLGRRQRAGNAGNTGNAGNAGNAGNMVTLPLALVRGEGGDYVTQAADVQRDDHPARSGTFDHGVPQLTGHQRRRAVPGEVVERRPVLAADLDDVGESVGGHQGCPRPTPLKQGVRRYGGAVGEPLDDIVSLTGAGKTSPVDGVEHRLGRVGGHRRHLLEDHPAVAADRDEIGEGPTHVNAEPHRHVMILARRGSLLTAIRDTGPQCRPGRTLGVAGPLTARGPAHGLRPSAAFR